MRRIEAIAAQELRQLVEDWLGTPVEATVEVDGDQRHDLVDHAQGVTLCFEVKRADDIALLRSAQHQLEEHTRGHATRVAEMLGKFILPAACTVLYVSAPNAFAKPNPDACHERIASTYATLEPHWTYRTILQATQKCNHDYDYLASTGDGHVSNEFDERDCHAAVLSAHAHLKAGQGLIRQDISLGKYDFKRGRFTIQLPHTVSVRNLSYGESIHSTKVKAIHLPMSVEKARNLRESIDSGSGSVQLLAIGHRARVNEQNVATIALRSRVLIREYATHPSEVIWMDGCARVDAFDEGPVLAAFDLKQAWRFSTTGAEGSGRLGRNLIGRDPLKSVFGNKTGFDSKLNAAMSGSGDTLVMGNGAGRVESLMARSSTRSKFGGQRKPKRKARVKRGRGEVNGHCRENDVVRVVTIRQRGILYCYETELARNPELQGKVTLSWSIGINGKVEKAVVVSSTLRNKKVEGCMTLNVHRWTFPKPEGGTCQIRFPFMFNAGL